MPGHLGRTSSREEQDLRATKGPPLAPAYLLGRRQRARRASLPLWLWLQANTFAPPWLPHPWRRPLMGYVMAMLLEIGAVSGTHLLSHSFSIFALHEVLVILGIIVTALNWGAGPGLLAILVGMAQLYVFVLFPQLPVSQREMADSLSVLVSWLIGLSICVVVSQSSGARRRAEELARSLSAEKARSEMERERLRTVLDLLPVGVFIADATGRILETNPACRAIWGEASPLVEAIPQYGEYKGWWPGTDQRVAAEEWALARALQQGEETLHEEIDIETFDGQQKTILNFAVPFRHETGAIAGGVVAILDISERKRLERELNERAAQLEATLENIADGLIVTDAQGRLLYLNSAYRLLLGLDVEPKGVTLPALQQIAGHVVLNAQGHPITEAERPLNRILQGEVLTGTNRVDLFLRTRAGREVQVNVSGAPIRDKASHLLGAVQVLRDVTEQRRLEQHTHDALHALLAMAEALVQDQPAPNDADPAGEQALRAEADARLPGVAQRLAELTRRVLGCRYVSMAAVEPETEALTPITVVGLAPEYERQWWASWDPPIHLSDDLQPGAVAALRAGEPVLLEAPLPMWQRLSAARTSLLVPMQVGDTLVGILRVEGGAHADASRYPHQQELIRAVARLGALVLERERLLHERAEARAHALALREANERMDTFLGVAGHELKTPLASTKLSVQLAQRRLQRLVQRRTDLVNEVTPCLEPIAGAQRQAERLERLVNDLLDVSRVQAGKLELRLEAADLAAIVCEAVEEQRQAAPARTLVLQLPDDLYVPITADADRIGQVVTNYLTNAFKYAPAERPIAVGITVDDRQARVWVRDEGPGLPAEEQEHIWDRFHQVQGIEVQSGSGVGLGLGLHICRTIIERHQGQVGVESAPGRGATFWFTLPLAPTGEA